MFSICLYMLSIFVFVFNICICFNLYSCFQSFLCFNICSKDVVDVSLAIHELGRFLISCFRMAASIASFTNRALALFGEPFLEPLEMCRVLVIVFFGPHCVWVRVTLCFIYQHFSMDVTIKNISNTVP